MEALTAVDSQTTLGSDHYDRALEDVFAVQDEIADELPYDLRAECERVREVPKDDPGARLAVAGPAPQEAAIRAEAKRLR